jgi:lysozyme
LKERDMPDEIITGISDANLAGVLDDYDFEGYAVIEKIKQPDGTWTVAARRNQANGADQSAQDDDAVGDDEPDAPAPPAGGPLTLGAQGAKLVKAFESCARRGPDGQFRPYDDGIGVLTIGWGHTNKIGNDQFNAGAVWSQQQCDDVFRRDMAKFENSVRKLVKVPLNQDQFDALASFCYNCGEGNLRKSTLLKKVNAGDLAGAALEFGKWTKGGGRVLKGLVRRRGFEARLFRGKHDANFNGDPPAN